MRKIIFIEERNHLRALSSNYWVYVQSEFVVLPCEVIGRLYKPYTISSLVYVAKLKRIHCSYA